MEVTLEQVRRAKLENAQNMRALEKAYHDHGTGHLAPLYSAGGALASNASTSFSSSHHDETVPLDADTEGCCCANGQPSSTCQSDTHPSHWTQYHDVDMHADSAHRQLMQHYQTHHHNLDHVGSPDRFPTHHIRNAHVSPQSSVTDSVNSLWEDFHLEEYLPEEEPRARQAVAKEDYRNNTWQWAVTVPQPFNLSQAGGLTRSERIMLVCLTFIHSFYIHRLPGRA